MIQNIGACHPDSEQFLNMDVLRPLSDAYKLDKTGSLSPQIDVCEVILSRASTPAEEGLIRGREGIRGEGRGIER